MADAEALAVIRQGSEAWQRWRIDRPGNMSLVTDLTYISDPTYRSLSPELARTMPHPNYVDLTETDLRRLVLRGADLQGVAFRGSNLEGADLCGADLFRADLSSTNLRGANLSEARIVEASLEYAQVTGANFTNAHLDDCDIYGISAWDVTLKGTSQTNLWFAGRRIALDGLETAQFMYLALDNQRLRSTIDTLALKAVLILGRFTLARKRVLDAIRDGLRHHGYVPMMFDFEKPATRNYTETVSTLAHLSRFIVADLTDAKVVLQELERTVPHLPSVPVQSILAAGFERNEIVSDLDDYPWFLPTFVYADQSTLLEQLKTSVIDPVEAKVSAIRARRAFNTWKSKSDLDT
jgi:hypothetical protein